MELLPLKLLVLLSAMVVASVAHKAPSVGVQVQKGQIKGKQDGTDFWCHTCQEKTQESCDNALTNTSCPRADSCIAFSDKHIFARKCVNTKFLKLLAHHKGCKKVGSHVAQCTGKKKYRVSWCGQAGCKAELSDFWCPACKNTTKESCDAALANMTCTKKKLCMALWNDNVFLRKCVDETLLRRLTIGCSTAFNSTKRTCRYKGKYHVTWCGQSGCKAEVTESSKAFWCPTCKGSSPDLCDASLTNTTCPKADSCMAFQDKRYFARKCVNKQFLNKITERCTNVSDTKRNCNGKRKYQVTWCDHSGCKAAVPGISAGSEKHREDVPFECPTCPRCRSPKECDNKLELTKCPRATRCLALRVNGTRASESMFWRKCVNEKAFKLMQSACAKRKGCQMSSCAQSGCKAAL